MNKKSIVLNPPGQAFPAALSFLLLWSLSFPSRPLAYYLGQLKEKFGDLKLALTAYNRGPTWVQRMIESNTALPLDYARKVLYASHNYREQGRQSSASSGSGKLGI
jgi:hypothetical protein